MPTRLLEFVSKREGNCNVMKSHNQSHDRSNQIGTILYQTYCKVDLSFIIHHLTYLIKSTFQINFWKSTYKINLLIESSMPLVCNILIFLTNVRT